MIHSTTLTRRRALVTSRVALRFAGALLLVAAASPFAARAATNDSDSVKRDEERAVVRARARERIVRPPGSHRPLIVTSKRGFLGVDLLELTPELRRHFRSDDDAGVLVAHVEASSPAALAGLAVGDVLVSIDGKPVTSSWSLRDLVAPRKAGDVVALEVVRDGGRQKLQATLAEREGRMLELGRMMQGHLLEDGDGDETVIVMPSAKDWEKFGKDWEKFGEEMGRWGEQFGEQLGADLAEAFADPQVRARIEREVTQREDLQRKIETLERRLRDLEKRLADEHR